jgi:2-amino-4-hydroxy-6-hydroxymethyldihydropteridine diphosphokinase
MHPVYLSLGSNIQPEMNLPRAIGLLREQGKVLRVSSAWESQAVGSEGPNFLNACVLWITPMAEVELKEKVIHPIETKLGRKRSADKNAPRSIDIDTILFDDRSIDDKYWQQAFVVVPLAEIHPGFQNPISGENIAETAARLRQEVWMEAHPEVLAQFNDTYRQP